MVWAKMFGCPSRAGPSRAGLPLEGQPNIKHPLASPSRAGCVRRFSTTAGAGGGPSPAPFRGPGSPSPRPPSAPQSLARDHTRHSLNTQRPGRPVFLTPPAPTRPGPFVSRAGPSPTRGPGPGGLCSRGAAPGILPGGPAAGGVRVAERSRDPALRGPHREPPARIERRGAGATSACHVPQNGKSRDDVIPRGDGCWAQGAGTGGCSRRGGRCREGPGLGSRD